MKKLASIFLTLALLAASLTLTTPSALAQSEDEQCNSNPLCVELREYGQIHGDEALRQHVESMLYQMSADAMDLGGIQFTEGDKISPLTNDPRVCFYYKSEACRVAYNGELFSSAGLATGIFTGCGVVTAGAGLAGCAVGSLAVHAFGIAAARSKRLSCEYDARAQCDSELTH